MKTLGEDLPKQMARIRDEVIPVYQEIGPAGSLAITFMKRDLDTAAEAMAAGDLAGMIRSYQSLKGYKLCPPAV